MHTPLRGALLASTLLFGTSGAALANDASNDIWHYLQHEGFINTWPSLNIAVHDGVATITGTVDSRSDRRQFERTVLGAPGVVEVRNLVQTSD